MKNNIFFLKYKSVNGVRQLLSRNYCQSKAGRVINSNNNNQLLKYQKWKKKTIKNSQQKYFFLRENQARGRRDTFCFDYISQRGSLIFKCNWKSC